MTVQSDVARARDLLQRGEIAAARPLLASALEDAPTNVDARFWLGVCDQFEGRPDQAEAAFFRVIAKDTHFAKAWYGLGTVLEQKGDDEAAHALYFRAAAEGSTAARKRLEQLGLSSPPVEPTESDHPARWAASSPVESSAVNRSMQASSSPIPTDQPAAAPIASPPLMAPDDAPTSTGRLRSLVSPVVRTVRILMLFVLFPLLVFSLVGAAIWFWGLMTEDSEEAQYFSLLFGSAALGLSALVWLVERTGNVRLQGVTQDVAYRQEHVGGGFRTPGTLVHGLSFTIAVTGPERDSVPLAAVEMRGRHIRGSIRNGQQVNVQGRATRDNYLKAHRVRILSTGQLLSARGSTLAEIVVPWIPFLLLVAAVVYVLALVSRTS